MPYEGSEMSTAPKPTSRNYLVISKECPLSPNSFRILQACPRVTEVTEDGDHSGKARSALPWHGVECHCQPSSGNVAASSCSMTSIATPLINDLLLRAAKGRFYTIILWFVLMSMIRRSDRASARLGHAPGWSILARSGTAQIPYPFI